ncbi:CDC24 [Candida oxycetoniae]|uniref:CDC24 n=1 Tax=Candida oxycetoniae TaxID=497107 RepID=A0AAI9SXX0_9ASCO|nr:CDC24 [Candida oxycetoniae]KAI3404889.2 CDC24 [Candida oxycetoniae]
MDSNHPPPFRSFSTTSSNYSFGSSSSSTPSRSNSSGPLNLSNFNKPSKPQDHLYYKCETLKRRLMMLDGMEPLMNLAFAKAEKLCEQQSLSLAQERNTTTMDRLSIQSGSSNGSGSHRYHATHGTNVYQENLLTFAAGVLPASISVDPATQLWQLFQEGASLCLIFNHLSEHTIAVICSDDVRVCKKSVYDFLIAVKTHLDFEDDELFTISNVFSDSTQDLLRIVAFVNRLLDLNPEFAYEEDDLNLEVQITDERSKVFKEIVDTERKYVHDLELLLMYKNELVQKDALTSEQIHCLFPNLNEIVDFQRRFLNSMECNINVPAKYQRLGSIFIHASFGPFKAYEPWTVGQPAAIDLINKEIASLRKASSLIDPGFELQSYILKPIQRLCKYPLLLKEFIKNDPYSTPSDELHVARAAMKEVANQVNEARRRSENVDFLHKLVERVSNWRGFSLKDQGELLYHGVVGVKDSETERDYVAYLFEKIIFFFVEVDKAATEKPEKKSIFNGRKKSSSSVSQSSASLLESLNAKNDKTPLELRGRVYIQEIYNITPRSSNGYTLVIAWSGKRESGSFTLKYRSEETRNQWEHCLRTLKTNEMNAHMNKKLRDSQSSTNTNDSSIYDYIGGATESVSFEHHHLRSANGPASRHHSSSSTHSMMRNGSRSKSAEYMRLSSSSSTASYGNSTTTTPLSSAPQSTTFDIHISMIYNHTKVRELLIVSSQMSFHELYSKISAKIAVSDVVSEDILVTKLRYKDEDGDFVVLDSNDDWSLAVDELNGKNTITIWVS